ncbi:methyltransferase, partial [Streptomyces sp. ST2-7A]|uniref:methyltransferase n=1 Tax=Streptomyces sp. ST2-7A TaxID=2907214 RepID=UPI001F2EBEB7
MNTPTGAPTGEGRRLPDPAAVVAADRILAERPEVARWRWVVGERTTALLVTGTDDTGVPPAAQPSRPSSPTGSAAVAADAAVEGEDLEALPGFMRLLDETALLSMARTLDRARLFRAGAAHTAEEVVVRLEARPRHAWIVRRWLGTLVAEGRLRRDPDTGRFHGLDVPDRAAVARSRRMVEEGSRGLGYPPAMTRFFLASADRLPLLLRDRAALQELLFPEGDAATARGNYRDSAPSRWANTAAAELVAGRVRPGAREPLRVLEVGAGVGGTTGAVLDALAGAPVDYLFTDVSRYFLGEGRALFGKRLRYGLFDIDADPAAQGLTDGSLDVVLAANVLHNARHVGRALAALRELLLPGGLLVLVESCGEHHQALTSMYFLMSARPGERTWFTDLRAGEDRVFLTGEEWARELDAAGFDPLPVLPDTAHPLARAAGQRVVAGRARAGARRPDPEVLAAALGPVMGADLPDRIHAVDRLDPAPPPGGSGRRPGATTGPTGLRTAPADSDRTHGRHPRTTPN